MLTFVIIFICVIVVYIHILFHLKVSNEIDIPHIDITSKDTLEKVGDLRQPFIFEREMNIDINNIDVAEDVNIKKGNIEVMVPYKAMVSAIKKEPYLSYKNKGFLNNSDLLKKIKHSMFLQPHMTLMSDHDILFGNFGVTTDILRSMNYRNYFCVMDGEIEIKLSPPKSESVLDGDIPPNIWEDENIKCDVIMLKIKKGSIIHIPAYWWYSIRFKERATVLKLSYITYMNAVSQVPFYLRKLVKSYKIEI